MIGRFLSVAIHLCVEDANAVTARAAAAGAKMTMPVTGLGRQLGQLEDPFGHCWSVGTQFRATSPQEMQQVMQQMMCFVPAKSSKIMTSRPIN